MLFLIVIYNIIIYYVNSFCNATSYKRMYNGGPDFDEFAEQFEV